MRALLALRVEHTETDAVGSAEGVGGTFCEAKLIYANMLQRILRVWERATSRVSGIILQVSRMLNRNVGAFKLLFGLLASLAL